RPAQLVARPLLLLPSFRGNTGLARRFFRHTPMLAAPAAELPDALDAMAAAHRLHVDRDHADRAVRLEVRSTHPTDVGDAVLSDGRLDLLWGETLVPQPVWHEGAVLLQEGWPTLEQPLAHRGQAEHANDQEVHREE